jgi:hypothetical protein
MALIELAVTKKTEPLHFDPDTKLEDTKITQNEEYDYHYDY